MSLLDDIDMGILYWLMLLLRAALTAVDVVLDLVAGVTVQGGSRAERRRAGEEYECSAHLVRILGRGNYREVERDLTSKIYLAKRRGPGCVSSLPGSAWL